jgi:hypothetical protein
LAPKDEHIVLCLGNGSLLLLSQPADLESFYHILTYNYAPAGGTLAGAHWEDHIYNFHEAMKLAIDFRHSARLGHKRDSQHQQPLVGAQSTKKHFLRGADKEAYTHHNNR